MSPAGDVKVRDVIAEEDWYSLRHSRVEEVEITEAYGADPTRNGSTVIRYRVLVWDEGREPFIRQLFNDPTPAMDFAEKVKLENESHHNIRR